jgi:hypothetical protein
VLVGVGERGILGDDLHRLLVRDREAVVAAHQDAISADLADEVLDHRIGVADRIVVKAPQVLHRAVPDVLEIGPLLPAAIEPPDEPRERAARVRQHDVELRESIQHPAEDQVRGRDGALERIAQEVGEIELLQPLVADHEDRVQEERQLERLDGFVHGEERLVGEVPAVDLGGHVEAAHPGEPGGGGGRAPRAQTGV